MEYTAGDGMVGYTATGGMKLDLRKEHTGTFNFPSCHYHGLTVAFDLDIIKRSLSDEIRFSCRARKDNFAIFTRQLSARTARR